MTAQPTTCYGWVTYELKEIAQDLKEIAEETDERITLAEALLCQQHITKILNWLILATRLQGRNIYRVPITPDQRCILKKFVRLIDNEIDENRGVPGPCPLYDPRVPGCPRSN